MGVYPVGSGNAEHKWVRNYLGISSPEYAITEHSIQVREYVLCEWEKHDLIRKPPDIENYANDRARPLAYVINYAFYGYVNIYTPFIYSDFFNLIIN